MWSITGSCSVSRAADRTKSDTVHVSYAPGDGSSSSTDFGGLVVGQLQSKPAADCAALITYLSVERLGENLPFHIVAQLCPVIHLKKSIATDEQPTAV